MSAKHRDLDSRLPPSMARKLKDVASDMSSMRVRGMSSRVYINEIVDAIHAGLLLAAMSLSLSLLELWIRDLLSLHLAAKSGAKTIHEFTATVAILERDIEGLEGRKASKYAEEDKSHPGRSKTDEHLRRLSFDAMCWELMELEVLDLDELSLLDHIYETIRNPIHHGITGRTVDPTGQNLSLFVGDMTRETVLIASIFGNAPNVRADRFEDYIYDTAPKLLKEIINFLIRHPLPDTEH
ncbi:MAG: hypothetical protein EPN68_11020 [Rhodanobacter sp.]|nr:MAG: hypothetical protein EPN68_11020 [Rhodanobacter sp.]